MPRDLERLLPLMRALWQHEKMDWHETRSPAALARLLGDDAIGRVWIAEQDERAVGYLALCFGFSLEFLGRDAFVDELYVDPDQRSRGLGRELLDVVAAACPEMGVRALHLEVDHENPRARDLYLRSGFRDHERFLMTRIPELD